MPSPMQIEVYYKGKPDGALHQISVCEEGLSHADAILQVEALLEETDEAHHKPVLAMIVGGKHA